MFLIQVTISTDGEVCWRGFIGEDSEPAECKTLEYANSWLDELLKLTDEEILDRNQFEEIFGYKEDRTDPLKIESFEIFELVSKRVETRG